MDEYWIKQVEKSDDPIWEAVGGGSNSFNEEQAGKENAKRICFVVYDLEMWLRAELRRKGYGSSLLALTE